LRKTIKCIKDMDIKELTERYRDRFDAHYLQDDNGTGRKGRKRKKEVETPNFLKDVIRPILDTLPDLLPEYGFTKTTDDYAMYGEYYRIKAGIVLVGGFSIDEDFNLYFTPLFHGKACGTLWRPAVRVKKSTASDNSLKSSANNLKEGR
jgi:hypothetical protein